MSVCIVAPLPPLRLYLDRLQLERPAEAMSPEELSLMKNLMTYDPTCSHCGRGLVWAERQGNTVQLVGDRLSCPKHVERVQSLINGDPFFSYNDINYRVYEFVRVEDVTADEWEAMKRLLTHHMKLLCDEHSVDIATLSRSPKEVIRQFRKGRYRFDRHRQPNLLKQMFQVTKATIISVAVQRGRNLPLTLAKEGSEA